MTAPTGDRTAEFRWLALLAATAALIWLTWSILSPFVEVLVWAGVMAILFQPVHRRLLAWTGRPSLASLLSVAVVLVVVMLPVVLVTVAVLREMSEIVNEFEGAFARLTTDPATAATAHRLLDAARRYVDIDALLSPDRLRDLAGRASQELVARSAGILGGVVGFFVSAGFTIFTLFYLFRDGEAMIDRLPGLMPLDRSRAEHLLRRTHEVVRASVQGVLIIAILQGFLGGAMFAIVGVPSPLLWGVLMTALSTVPVGGSALVWGPAAAILIATGAYGRGLALLAFGALVIGALDNVLRPRLVGGRAGMHDLLIFFAVIGGMRAFGVAGLLLGPVILAVTMSLLGGLFEEKADAGAAAPG